MFHSSHLITIAHSIFASPSQTNLVPSLPQAGRQPHLDTLAHNFFKSTSDAERLNVVAATLEADTPQGEAKYYVYVMNKIVSGKGKEYVEHESKRCVCFDRFG
jgi:hypothetical protein